MPAAPAAPTSSAAGHPLFIKVVADRKRVSHVAKVKDARSLAIIKPYISEAYRLSLSSEIGPRAS
jgi:hypothetical protein